MSNDFDREQLLSIFLAEAGDGMATLWTALHPPGEIFPTPRDVQPHYAIGHKIKGAALLYGYPGLAKLGGIVEGLLDRCDALSEKDWEDTVRFLRELVSVFRAQLELIGRGSSEDAGVGEEWEQKANRLAGTNVSLSADDSCETPVSPEYLLPQLDQDTLSYFLPEADEYLGTIQTLVGELPQHPEDEQRVHTLFRACHTLKGSAYTVGCHVVGDIACPMEESVAAVREGLVQLRPEMLDRLQQGIDLIRLLLTRSPDDLEELRHRVPRVIQALRACSKPIPEAEPSQPQVAVNQPAVSEAPPTVASPVAQALAPAVGESQQDEELYSEAYLIPNLDPEVLSYFAPEAHEYLETLESLLLKLEAEPGNRETIHQLFRTAHTLKGSAYTVGFQSIGDLTHHIEDFMGAVREGRLSVKAGRADLLLRAVDVMRMLMRRDPGSLDQTRQRYALIMGGLKQLYDGTAQTTLEVSSARTTSVEPLQAAPTTVRDHEPAKLAETRGSEERDVIRVSRDRLERLLNLVGELVIERGRLEQRLGALERLSQQVISNKSRLVEVVRSFEDKHTFTMKDTAITSEVAAPAFPGLNDFGSLEFDQYDDFNILSRRISEVTADITESMSQLSGSIRRAQDDMNQLQQLTLGMRDEIARARMVPIGTPFTRFRRAVREMARASAKEVTLVTSGEHTEIDTGLVERIVDPLIHLVRNAVYHGIEPTAERVKKGKPAAGTIYLHAAHRGNAVVLEVEDDGAGIDIERIKSKAVRLGLVRSDLVSSIPDSEALKFIFLPGFSTAEAVGDQAGRGVGLDVVKRVIEAMNGHIEVESVRGAGTKFTLHLPVTLLIATALIVRAGTYQYAIPLPGVREVTMASPGSLKKVAGRHILHIGDEAIEVQPLDRLVVRETGSVDPLGPVVIVRTASGPLGVAVDELLGRQEIVIKSLGALQPFERSCFGGATIDPEGHVILVLDVSRLGARDDAKLLPVANLGAPEPETETPEIGAADSAQKELPILLIDDSLSIRKFVGRMLETAGYIVETAVDGEEGLRKAAAQSYRLIITDLEMPKLNGYEVIQALRGRPQTQSVPIIVMTTRAGEKHRQMALNIGATSYIAKPVEERALFQEIQRTTGQGATVKN